MIEKITELLPVLSSAELEDINMFRFLNRLFCYHSKLKFKENLYGEHIIWSGGKRSRWQCECCGKNIYKDTLYNKLESDSVNDAYFDRNQAVLALAKLGNEIGAICGFKIDKDNPDWIIVFAEFADIKQVSWHIPASEMPTGLLPAYKGDWDGHTLEEKRERMKSFIEMEA